MDFEGGQKSKQSSFEINEDYAEQAKCAARFRSPVNQRAKAVSKLSYQPL